MTKKIPTKSVPKQKYAEYWQKAQGFFQTMTSLYDQNNWNSAALEGIHAAILAADAVLIFLEGHKSSSQKHADVEALLSSLPVEGAHQASSHLSKILNLKNLVEYSGDSYLREEAQAIVKHVDRLFTWAKEIF